MFALTEFHATLAADNDDGDDGGNEIQLNEEDSSSQAMTVKVIQKYQKLKQCVIALQALALTHLNKYDVVTASLELSWHLTALF